MHLCTGPDLRGCYPGTFAAPAPVAVCEPTCAPKKHCGLLSGLKGIKLCHKKAVCAPAPVAVCETVAYSAPVTYSYSAPAVYSSPQVSAQH